MGGIQSKNALPDSPVFSEISNPYDVASYKRICAEFNVDPSTDFRYTRGKNGSLGTVYIGATGLGAIATTHVALGGSAPMHSDAAKETEVILVRVQGQHPMLVAKPIRETPKTKEQRVPVQDDLDINRLGKIV